MEKEIIFNKGEKALRDCKYVSGGIPCTVLEDVKLGKIFALIQFEDGEPFYTATQRLSKITK